MHAVRPQLPVKYTYRYLLGFNNFSNIFSLDGGSDEWRKHHRLPMESHGHQQDASQLKVLLTVG